MRLGTNDVPTQTIEIRCYRFQSNIMRIVHLLPLGHDAFIRLKYRTFTVNKSIVKSTTQRSGEFRNVHKTRLISDDRKCPRTVRCRGRVFGGVIIIITVYYSYRFTVKRSKRENPGVRRPPPERV